MFKEQRNWAEEGGCCVQCLCEIFLYFFQGYRIHRIYR